MRRLLTAIVCVATLLGSAGCGAAYYGTALAIILTQNDSSTTDTSFPDAVPTGDATPAAASLVLSSNMVTVERGEGDDAMSVTDFEVLGVEFPDGYGTSQSNRDITSTLTEGDRLVVRINGDVSQELLVGVADVAATGSTVATSIQGLVRALTPIDPDVPAEAYTRFEGSFDPATNMLTFTSGVPGTSSEVVFQPEPRTDVAADAVLDVNSEETSARLGLGVVNGGIERAGMDQVGFTVINRGTDSIPEGTNVNLYLSHDKLLDPMDLLIDQVPLPETVAVGEARRFFRRNGGVPPETLLRRDFTSGSYYVLYEVEESGGEQVTENNLLVSRSTVEIYQPIDDPTTTDAEEFAALDFTVTRTVSPIAQVTNRLFPMQVTVSNFGAPVTAPTSLELDLILSGDTTFEPPAFFSDPDQLLAGIQLNPRDPGNQVRVVFDDTGTDPLSTQVFNDVITVRYDGAGISTIQSLITALDTAPGGLVDASWDGFGDPSADALSGLVAAVGETEFETGDVLITTQVVNFRPETLPMQEQAFLLGGVIATNAVNGAALPVQVFPFVRLRGPGDGTLPENPRNNVRQASNFTRVYDQATSTFDATTGAVLPTINPDDFAALDAVSLRPVNTGSIRQGQQRVFSFQLPTTGLSFDESQLLVILRSANFDAHIDLLGPSGEFLAGNDDSALGFSPIIYTPAQSNSANRTLYLVVSSARADGSDLSGGGETFELTISVNARLPGDLGLVNAVDGANIVTNTAARFEPNTPRLQNDVLVPYSLTNGRAEIMFVLPARARVRFISRPVPTLGLTTVITEFIEGSVPSPVENQPELDAVSDRVVFRPEGGSILASHILDPGVYTVAFDGINNQTDDRPLRLEVETLFLPPGTN